MTDMPTLVKRLRDTVVARSTCKEAADALEAAERVIAPFAAAADKADEKAAMTERLGMGRLTDNASTGLGIKFGHVRAARDWLAAHATGQRTERADALTKLAELDADLITGQRKGGDE